MIEMLKRWLPILMALFAMFGFAGCHVAGSASIAAMNGQAKLTGEYDVTLRANVMGFDLPILVDLEFPPGSAVTYNDVMRNYTAKLRELGVAPNVAADMVRAEVLAYMEDVPITKLASLSP